MFRLSSSPASLLVPLLLVVGLFSGPAAAHALPHPEEGEEEGGAPLWSESLSLEELLQIELAAPSKQMQTAREAPGVATVVTREQILQFGWTSLDDILFSQPGFFPSQDFERRVVGSRGIWEGWSNNHLLLLVDGVPVNDSDTATAYTSELTPLFMVKSVEIIRGPGSALYGSSATQGVVAINTISAPRTLGEDERLEINSHARLQFGNRGTLGLELVAATQSRHVSTVLGFQARRTAGEGYLSADASGRTDDTGALRRFHFDDRRGSDTLFAKLEGRRGLEGLSLQYHLQSWEYGTGLGWAHWAPDTTEPLRDQRHIAVLRYRSPSERRLQQEYVVRFQRHEYTADLQYYPSGALDGYYPVGVREVARYGVDELFGRFQLSSVLAERLSLLGGVEYSVFLYGGDEEHFSNAELDNEEAGFPPAETWVPLGPVYEPILDRPVNNLGAFTQVSWNRLLDTPLSLTVGLRYDLMFFRYVEEADGAPRELRRSYEQVSPRLALVYSPSPALSLKLQASRAFRAPAPGELFGANTWILKANIATLRPERVTTFDFNADWIVSPRLNWRNTIFLSSYQNLIGYSGSNLSTNLFSRRNVGLESEVQTDAELPGGAHLLAFGSYSFVHLLDETDGGGGLVANAGRLTWAPAHQVKAGVNYREGRFSASLQGRYQSTVHRQGADRTTPLFADARPASVPAWVRFDANARYQLNGWSTLALTVTNLLDAESYLVRTGDYPFDYRMEGRRIFGTLEIDL